MPMATTPDNTRALRTPGLLPLAWPMAMENLLNMSLTWVDSIIINHKLGTESFAAIQMAGQLMNIITLVIGVVATGASIVISHQVGSGDREEAGETANQSIGAAFLTSLGLGLAVYGGAGLMLTLLGARGVVHDQGVTFLQTLGAFMPATAAMAILGAVLRAAGDTRGPMFVTLLVNVLNALLNFSFVWGIPALGIEGGMGVFGSALGTSLARICGALLMLAMLLHRSEVPVRVARFFRFKAATLWRVARMGVPGALEWVSWQSSQLVLTAIVAPLGATAIAARGISAQTEFFTIVPGGALGGAASILVGQLMGAREREKAVKSGGRAMVWAVLSMVGLGGVLFLFPRQIAGIFTTDAAVLDIAVKVLRVAAIYKAGQALNIVCGGIFRGAGNPQWPVVLTTLGTWSITVPAAYCLVRAGYGLPGVVWATLTDESVRGALNLWYFTTPRWRFRKV